MHDECRLEQLLLQEREEAGRWMLMRWYGEILGGPQLSLIVLSLAPHWPEFSALWANGGSALPRDSTRSSDRTADHLLSREQIQATDMNVKAEPERNKLIGQKRRLVHLQANARTAELHLSKLTPTKKYHGIVHT